MGGLPEAVVGTPSGRALRTVLVLLAALLPAVAVAPGPAPLGPAAAVAQAGASTVPPPTAAEQRRAGELRRVAREALARRASGGDGPDLDGSLLGIGSVVWRVLAVVLVLIAVLVGIALYRRGPRRRRRGTAVAAAGGDDVAELERQARRAEEDGEHRTAVVLWFRAGAQRLGARLRVRADRTATAGDVARRSGDPRVGALAVAHDRAAYGPGPVGPDDSRGAREGWAAVLRAPGTAVGDAAASPSPVPGATSAARATGAARDAGDRPAAGGPGGPRTALDADDRPADADGEERP